MSKVRRPVRRGAVKIVGSDVVPVDITQEDGAQNDNTKSTMVEDVAWAEDNIEEVSDLELIRQGVCDTSCCDTPNVGICDTGSNLPSLSEVIDRLNVDDEQPVKSKPMEKPKRENLSTAFEASREQKKLYELLAGFAVATVTEWVAVSYRMFSREAMRGSMLPILISRVAEEYFNKLSRQVYTREDAFINEKFDEMLAIELPEIEESGNDKYDPMDLLNIIVPISMQTLIDMNIRDLISDDNSEETYKRTMQAIVAHLKSLVKKFSHISITLRGCNCVEKHTPPAEDEKVFKIELQQAVLGADGEVEIKDNWFDEV
jgi:hypothetical protein